MPEIERDGEELPRLSPGVGYDSTAHGEMFCYRSPCGVQRWNCSGTYVDKFICAEWVSSCGFCSHSTSQFVRATALSI